MGSEVSRPTERRETGAFGKIRPNVRLSGGLEAERKTLEDHKNNTSSLITSQSIENMKQTM